MTPYPPKAGSPAERSTSSTLRWEAKILHYVVREAIRTSPDSFLKTVVDVDAKALNYWIDEIRSSTWVVAQRTGEVVGVAAAKQPDLHKDQEDQAAARYIESVWIAPYLRGCRLGERLIKYLLIAEYEKQHINQFLLWVFATNSSAIRLYEHMGFVRTSERNEGIRTEIKYRLDFTPEVHASIGLAVNDAALGQNQRQYGVTYRTLGRNDQHS